MTDDKNIGSPENRGSDNKSPDKESGEVLGAAMDSQDSAENSYESAHEAASDLHTAANKAAEETPENDHEENAAAVYTSSGDMSQKTGFSISTGSDTESAADTAQGTSAATAQDKAKDKEDIKESTGISENSGRWQPLENLYNSFNQDTENSSQNKQADDANESGQLADSKPDDFDSDTAHVGDSSDKKSGTEAASNMHSQDSMHHGQTYNKPQNHNSQRQDAQDHTPPYGYTPYNQPGYGQAPNNHPGYGQAPNGQPGYGQAPNSHPGYGQAQNGQPGYGQTPNSYPSYGQAQNGQPNHWQQANGQPPMGQPFYGHTPYGWQPTYNQQQTPYGPPQNYSPAPAFHPQPQKKKKSRGLKAFLWVLSILCAGSLLGFVGYLISGYQNNPPVYEDTPPAWYDRGQEDSSEDSVPGFDDGVEAPDPDQKTPDIEIPGNPAGILINPMPEGDPLAAKQVYEKVSPSTVTVSVSIKGNIDEDATSTGTGIIATSDGYIITNSHVVFNSKNTVVRITTLDGDSYDAIVVGTDRTTDLAILKTNDHNFTPAEFGDPEMLDIGDEVIAIGNPGGEQFSGSLTKGVISGKDRIVGDYSDNGMTYIQTDAAINPGNSGGPLVNMYGQVIAINSAKIVSVGYEGMGFAIPVDKAKDILDELTKDGYIKGRTRLGIKGTDITEYEYSFYNVPYGLMIHEISEESAFSNTKAQVYDIITAIDEETVTGIESISNILLRYEPGDKAVVSLYRPSEDGVSEGKELEVEITLLPDNGETQN